MKFRINEIYYVRKFLFNHNQAAFVKLYNLHTPAMFRVAMQLTAGDKPVAEAIVIKTWNRAIENLSSVSSISQLGTWLTSLVVICSREYYHRHHHYMLIHDPLFERVISRKKRLYAKSADINSEHALELLPIGYRHVFVLHDINGYGHKAISALLQISERVSQRLLFKTRNAIGITGNGSEMKTFCSAYSHISLPNELERKVWSQLSEKGLVLPQHKMKNYLDDLINTLANTGRLVMNYRALPVGGLLVR